jgi:hypothetical protein
MRTIALLAAAAALSTPAAALATKPPLGNSATTTNTHAATPRVTYVLRGTLLAYSNPGAVQITVKSAISGGNHAAKALAGHTYALTVISTTKVTLHNGKFTSNDKGVVKFQAQKGLTDATGQTATQIIDQGRAHS